MKNKQSTDVNQHCVSDESVLQLRLFVLHCQITQLALPALVQVECDFVSWTPPALDCTSDITIKNISKIPNVLNFKDGSSLIETMQ